MTDTPLAPAPDVITHLRGLLTRVDTDDATAITRAIGLIETYAPGLSPDVPTFPTTEAVVDDEVVCPSCGGTRLRYRESVDEYREVVWRPFRHLTGDDEPRLVLSYSGEHGDGESDGVIYCMSCLTEWSLPDDFEWD